MSNKVVYGEAHLRARIERHIMVGLCILILVALVALVCNSY